MPFTPKDEHKTRSYQTHGILIGSIVGCLLAGVLVYLKVSIVIIIITIIAIQYSGYYVGGQVRKD